MKSENNSDLYLYAFDHSSFKAGNWWSGMANASVGLAFLIGYDIFRDSLYLNKARRAINGVINPVQDNGCSIKIGKNEWFLEYVAPETDSSNAFFVLNGFLYQLLSIKIFDRYLHDQMYANAFTSGLSALKDLDSMYYYRKSNWTYYMLNPVTIESAHYSIFDLLLFSSLDKIHQDDYFTESIRKRQGILRNSYCLTITDDTVLFSLIGVPHPYWIDVYQIVIIGYNDDGEITGQFSVSDPRNFDIPLFKRAFLRIPLNNHIKRLSVFSKYYSDSILLYTISKEQIAEKESMNNCSVFANFELMSDGSKDNNNKFALSVNSSYSELSRAIVRIFPKNVLDIYENKYFGFELISDTDIRSVLIDIINTEGQSACRYYMPLPKDTNNLVLLNREGFKGIDGFISNDISEIRLSLYTDTLEYTGLYNLHLLKILKFKNDIDLFNYFSSNKFCLVEEELPGNLY
ncbi:MAG: D-glucuronyl C5-epimerase family protein [Bacteroidetes bacterium]|nr:D-glucuronyl C5-epimerase family protein [Bacteroidota bacterium]